MTRKTASQLLVSVGALLLYFIMGKLGLELAISNSIASAIWAPTGIALALLLVSGTRWWPLVFLGAFLVDITNSQLWRVSLTVAAGNTLEAVLGAYLVGRFARGARAFEQAHDIGRFAFLTVGCATPVSATIGVASLVWAGLVSHAGMGSAWLTWWLGDAVGGLLVTPVIVLWWMGPHSWPSRNRLLEIGAFLLSFVVLGFVIFTRQGPFGAHNFPVQHFVIWLIVLSAFRVGPRITTSCMIVLLAIAITGTREGAGPFGRFRADHALLLLQSWAGILTLTGLVVATLAKQYHHTEETLRQREEQHRVVIEGAPDAIIGQSIDGHIVSWNHAAEVIYGYTADEAIGQSMSILMPTELAGEMARLHERIRRGERIPHYETERICKNSRRIQVALAISPIEDESGSIVGASTIASDITKRKRAEEQIRHQAQHDALTGLPNRLLLRDRITQSIVRARRSHEQVAVLFLDLDRFKEINDSLGHQAGDQLLRSAAHRLQRSLREGDSIARLGGDEFVINLPGLSDSAAAMVIADKILRALRGGFVVDHQELHVTGSIGISLYPGDGLDAAALMRAADTAMYHAKESGRDNYQFFTARLNEAALRRLTIANSLPQALQNHEFTLEYQPQVRLEDGEIVAVEALIRWRHAALGIVPPSEFIHVADETGIVGAISEWVFAEASKQLVRWRALDHPALRLAVNLSPQQCRKAGLASFLSGLLRERGLSPSALELEITENALMAQGAETVSVLEELAGTGVRMAIDNFGTGYSSLAYLPRLSIHSVKIGRAFVNGIGVDDHDAAVVSAIIAMARSLNLSVVAEGVETENQVEFLKAHECHAAQGFLFSRPMSADDLSGLLLRNRLICG